MSQAGQHATDLPECAVGQFTQFGIIDDQQHPELGRLGHDTEAIGLSVGRVIGGGRLVAGGLAVFAIPTEPYELTTAGLVTIASPLGSRTASSPRRSRGVGLALAGAT